MKTSIRTFSKAKTFLVALLAAALLAGVTATPASAEDLPTNEATQTIFTNTNTARASYGKAPLTYNTQLAAVAQKWAEKMSTTGYYGHNPNLQNEVPQGAFVTASENVAMTYSYYNVVNFFMGSTDHRNNILSSYTTEIGIGYVDNGQDRWTVQVFSSYPKTFTQTGEVTIQTPNQQPVVYVGSTVKAVITKPFVPSDGITYDYYWATNGNNTGETGATKIVTDKDLGKKLTVTVIARKASYNQVILNSQPVSVANQNLTVSTKGYLEGSNTIGSTIILVPSKILETGTTTTYQWKANGTDIAGATAATYVINPVDAGKTISLNVTVSKAGYNNLVYSPTLAFPVPKANFTTIGKVTVIGDIVVGGTINAVATNWAPKPDSYRYIWKIGTTVLSNKVNDSSFIIPTNVAGQKLTVIVYADKTGYNTSFVESNPTIPVINTFKLTPAATFTGDVFLSSTLTVKIPTAWSPAAEKYTYQWFANGTAITGATSTTFKITEKELGKKITAKVTGYKTGFKTVTVGAPTTIMVKENAKSGALFILNDTNFERNKVRKSTLTRDPQLDAIALNWAQQMATTGKVMNDPNLLNKVKTKGYKTAGQVVTANPVTVTAAKMVDGWIANGTKKATITGSWSKTGIAYYWDTKTSRYMAVQVFAR
jgi:uncharacterized protein YkwD